MNIELLSLLFVVVFIVILLLGVPLAFATGAVAVVFAYSLFGLPGLTLVVSRVFTLMGNYVLVSVPLFILMACILERAGIAESIFRAVHVWSARCRPLPSRALQASPSRTSTWSRPAGRASPSAT